MGCLLATKQEVETNSQDGSIVNIPTALLYRQRLTETYG